MKTFTTFAAFAIAAAGAIDANTQVNIQTKKSPVPQLNLPTVDFGKGLLKQYEHLVQDPLSDEQAKLNPIQPNLAWPTDDCILGFGQAAIWASTHCGSLSDLMKGISTLVTDFEHILTCIRGVEQADVSSCTKVLSDIKDGICDGTCSDKVVKKVGKFITEGCSADLASNNIPVVLIQSVVESYYSASSVICTSSYFQDTLEDCFDYLLEDLFTYYFKFQESFDLQTTFNGTEALAVLNGSYFGGFINYLPTGFVCTSCVKNVFSLLYDISAVNISASFFVNNFEQFGKDCGADFFDGWLGNLSLNGLPNKVNQMYLEPTDIFKNNILLQNSNVGKFINNTHAGGPAGATPWANTKENAVNRLKSIINDIDTAQKSAAQWAAEPISKGNGVSKRATLDF